MALEQVIADGVRGLGLELVELERLAGGVLRVTIDYPWQPDAQDVRAIGVDDCERVSHQLQYALEVEGVDYRRLEVSSPGVDRPLRTAADFARFSGERVELRFREPVQGEGADGRKVFHGTLEHGADDAHWQIAWSVEDKPAAGRRRGSTRHAADEAVRVMSFALDELASARLAPLLNFKRARAPKEPRPAAQAAGAREDRTE